MVTSFGLIAGVGLSEQERLTPGFLCDLFLYRRRYDDQLHGVTRGVRNGRNKSKKRH
jgi:hypothetical protein